MPLHLAIRVNGIFAIWEGFWINKSDLQQRITALQGIFYVAVDAGYILIFLLSAIADIGISNIVRRAVEVVTPFIDFIEIRGGYLEGAAPKIRKCLSEPVYRCVLLFKKLIKDVIPRLPRFCTLAQL
ncbi:hypothetical protein D3C78_887310 [compost metagenome]